MKYVIFTLLSGAKFSVKNTIVMVIEDDASGVFLFLDYAIQVEGEVLQKVYIQESLIDAVTILNA